NDAGPRLGGHLSPPPPRSIALRRPAHGTRRRKPVARSFVRPSTRSVEEGLSVSRPAPPTVADSLHERATRTNSDSAGPELGKLPRTRAAGYLPGGDARRVRLAVATAGPSRAVRSWGSRS